MYHSEVGSVLGPHYAQEDFDFLMIEVLGLGYALHQTSMPVKQPLKQPLKQHTKGRGLGASSWTRTKSGIVLYTVLGAKGVTSWYTLLFITRCGEMP